MEFVTTFGFPSWGDKLSPCPCCWATMEDWDEIAGISLISLPWAEKTFQDYDAACTACEHWITIPDAAVHSAIKAALVFDKSTDGGGRKIDARGRALVIDFPSLGLKAGDRLEPHPGMMDIADFDRLPVGSLALFWRRSSETGVRRRNPLFDEETGIVPSKVFYPDWLHDQALGVDKWYIVTLFHRLVSVNAFGVSGRDAAARFQESANRIKDLLFPWYETAEGPQYSKRSHFSAEIFGTTEKHLLHTFGEEALGLLCFTPVLLQQFGGALPAVERANLERMGQGLIGMYRITMSAMHMGPLPTIQAQAYCDHAKSVWQARRALNMPFKPKYHRMAHTVKMLLTHGSPWVWGCWRDEAENKVFKKIAFSAHRLVWHKRILATHRAGFGLRRGIAARMKRRRR